MQFTPHSVNANTLFKATRFAGKIQTTLPEMFLSKEVAIMFVSLLARNERMVGSRVLNTGFAGEQETRVGAGVMCLLARTSPSLGRRPLRGHL